MEKLIYDEKNGLHYTLAEDGMYYPDFKLAETDHPIGKYGMLHETYLKEHRRGTYTRLIMKGILNEHLHKVDVEAREMVENMISRFAECNGCDEQFKAENQLQWVQKMENYKVLAEERVLRKIVYR